MFKKQEIEYKRSEPLIEPTAAQPTMEHTTRTQATIGASITIKGDLVGEEDLVIQGRVEGMIKLKQNSVIVGKEGRISADIHSKSIIIEGQVDGDLIASEHVQIRSSGSVNGNIVAPRVALEDGCTFKGTIDMTSRPAEQPAGQSKQENAHNIPSKKDKPIEKGIEATPITVS